MKEIGFLKDKGGGRHILRLDSEVKTVEREYQKDRIFDTSTMVFEQNYLNTPDYSKLTVKIDTPSCSQGFGGFALSCFFGYLKTDKLIRESDDNTLFKVRELAIPMEAVTLGKRFSSGEVVNTYLMFSKDEQYAFLFTHNANN